VQAIANAVHTDAVITAYNDYIASLDTE
jgi:hypothetical protein